MATSYPRGRAVAVRMERRPRGTISAMWDHPEIKALVEIGRKVRDRVRAAMLKDRGELALPAGESAGDLQYAIDRLSEESLASVVEEAASALLPLRLLAEGTDQDGIEIGGPAGRWLVIDPIDGTRGLMHGKRSAFFLAGLARPALAPRLSDLTTSVMVEIPTVRSALSDILVARRGEGVAARTEDLDRGGSTNWSPRPSQATTLRHGFGTIVRFFAGAAEPLGRLHDALMAALFPGDAQAAQDVFEDQYISNGGQMHALITGRDRFVADLRPLFLTGAGASLRCAHPYDVLGALIAEEAGVPITDPTGAPLDVPLDLTTRVAWIGYANSALRTAIQSVLVGAMRSCGGIS